MQLSDLTACLQNVLLSRTGEAKLADVGLARVLKGGDYTQSADPGTWAYASPEVVGQLSRISYASGHVMAGGGSCGRVHACHDMMWPLGHLLHQLAS